RVNGATVELAPDEIIIFPGRADSHTLGKLGGAVSTKSRDQVRRYGDSPSALGGLEVSEGKTAAHSFWARSGMGNAAGRAVRTVPLLATGVRVVAAVAPALPLQLDTDNQSALV